MEFEVVLSALMERPHLVLLAEASIHGQENDFVEAMKEVRSRLRAGSLRGSERDYRLPSGAPVYHLVVRPLSGHFAMYLQQRMAWITKMDRLAGPDEQLPG